MRRESEVGDERRVVPTGVGARSLRLLATSLLTVMIPFALVVAALTDVLPEWWGWFALPFVGGLLWVWARLPMTGVSISRDALVVRSWWSTRTYCRADVERCRAEAYGGWMYVFGWPVVSGSLQSGSLLLETVDGDRALGGTVTSMYVARRQAELVNQWLGLQVGAGRGPRRNRGA